MAAARTPEANSEERRSPQATLRVVVADDDRDTVDTLAALLEHEGHAVYRVYTGKDVLPTVRTARPDVVLLDIALPGISGYAVAQEIRYSFTDLRRPLLIAISGMWIERSDRNLARQVGFDEHLTKPCEPQEILALVARLRSHKPADAA